MKLAVSSEGMIANSLAALIVAKELKKDISPYADCKIKLDK
ncbi:hypothetical protein PSG99_11960 [Enterococcus faecium]|nr:hypothetical protein [Enterococcus faecium]